MSFGYSVGDVLVVGQLCWKVYKRCKDSPGNYAELTGEVGALHNVVKETEELLSTQALTSKQQNKLLTCRQGCESVLKDLDGLLVKYESLGTNTRRTFDRMGFGVQDMKDIRLRLISNVSMLDAFNNVSSQARLENKMNILIAEVRAGKREGSVISTMTFDASAQIDRDTWEALRRDLEDVGISRDVITEKRQFIINWFQQAVAAGNFEEEPPSDDEDVAVSESGSDRDLTSMMIDHTAIVEDTRKISVDNPQRSLKRSNETTNSRRGLAIVKPSKEERKSRMGISYLFDKLRWKSDNPDWPSKRFLNAAMIGDVPRVRDLLEKGVYIEYKDGCERTALAIATNKGNDPVARLLLEHGANPESKDWRGDTALILAASAGLLSTTQLLLEKGANTECTNVHDETPLSRAARYGYDSVVQVLLEKGANIERMSNLGATPLMVAAGAGHKLTVRVLLEKGAYTEPISFSGEMPLMIAAEAGHESIVRVLLEKGANTEPMSRSGETPLMVAARAGHVSVVKTLLEKGANVHTRDIFGNNALYYVKDNEKVARLLRSAGVEDRVSA